MTWQGHIKEAEAILDTASETINRHGMIDLEYLLKVAEQHTRIAAVVLSAEAVELARANFELVMKELR